MTSSLVFFLGGHDLEMTTIRGLVEDHLGPQAVRDHGLTWGARLSDYADELNSLGPNQVPVLVELTLDMAPPPKAVIVDHHGTASAGKTSLEQVFGLLGLGPAQWSRHLALVAANDRGHVRALRSMGATPDEIAAIRTADRKAQGITPKEEEEAIAALAQRQECLGGRLSLLHLPHSRTATVMDRIASPADAIPNVLILCPDEVAFYGVGPAIIALDSAFPGGFSGGDLPVAGFWGHAAPVPSQDALVDTLRPLMCPRETGSF